jgi:mRNA interferase YafQ
MEYNKQQMNFLMIWESNVLEIKIEKAFKKDITRDKKSGFYSVEDFELLKTTISKLQNKKEIDKKFNRHPLKGNMKGFESIHLKGDWLLIFKIDEVFLNLVMLGKHTQVYKKFK